MVSTASRHPIIYTPLGHIPEEQRRLFAVDSVSRFENSRKSCQVSYIDEKACRTSECKLPVEFSVLPANVVSKNP